MKDAADRLLLLAQGAGRLVPDALTTSVLLLALLFGAALVLGNSFSASLDAYYRGLWSLLPFTMQMTLILVLSSTLCATLPFTRLVVWLSRLPRTSSQVLATSLTLIAALSYLNWGLGLAMGPLVAVYFAREAERKGIGIDFPFLVSVNHAAQSVWQLGLSASAPLLMNTPGHFLESATGRMPLTTTIFAPASLTFVCVFVLALFLAARALLPRSPKPVSAFPESCRAVEQPILDADGPAPGFSERLERQQLPTLLLSAALLGWLFQHFVVKGASVDLNALNTSLLLASLLLHGSVSRFTRALQAGVAGAWPVILLYHLYAGVAGLLQHTSVGAQLAGLIAAASTPTSFPLLTAGIAAVMGVFVPSSGGQWVVQGFVTVTSAAAVGVSPQRGLLALSVGDHVGNLVSPFWVAIQAGIGRLDFRSFIGYNALFATLWFALGVLAFTFLPA